jgi:hypothetical protein
MRAAAVEQSLVGQPLRAQRSQCVVPEPEVRQDLQQPAGAGEDAVAATVGEPAGEDLEDAVAAGSAVGEGGGDHRQLVPVGEQRGSRGGRSRRHGREA